MIDDKNLEGMVVSKLFSIMVACKSFQPFVKAIKNKLPEFKTKVLLTDDTSSFCNACQTNFKDDTKHILCAWHVLRNCNVAKFKDETIRLEIKKDMETFFCTN